MSHDSSLEPLLRAVEPAVRLIPARHLRKVLNYLLDHDHHVPTNTDLPYWVDREPLLAAEILPAWVLEGTEPKLLLITDPDDRMIDHLAPDEQLHLYWRVLFRAAILAEFDRRFHAGDTNPGFARLDHLGPAAAREIEYVLQAEHCAHPNQSAPGTARMFAAIYLDLATFEPHAIEYYFPSLPRAEADRLLREAYDVPTLLARTRPTGAAEVHREPPTEEHWAAEPPATPPPPPDETTSVLVRRAREAAERGNNVRAAILSTQAAATPGADRSEALSAAMASTWKLVEALGELFGWDHHTRQEWLQALAPLLDRASAGVWPRAARCLYELQTIPADLSREVFAIDLPEYLRTFGRRPVKRELPNARPVRILMALKKAQAQLLRAGLAPPAQLRLDRLLHHQIHALEQGIRRDFTPLVGDALTRAGLVPLNTVEEVARDKLVAELLDRVCDRGYLRLGDLRDAIARNRLKMGDSALAFVTGDALLRVDANLAETLDGVYRRGEVYLRFLQRFSALFFANPLGRLFTLFIAIPFGGAFLTLMFAEEMRHIGENIVESIRKGTEPKPVESPELITTEVPTGVPPHHKSRLTDPRMIIGFGVFLLFMIHAPPLRRAVFTVLSWVWWVVRGVLWDIPLLAWRSRTVREIRHSIVIRFVVRRFWSPTLIVLIAFGVTFLLTLIPWIGIKPQLLFRWWLLIWAVLTVAYNTPWGWVIQDRVTEALSDWWRVVRVNLLPGLLQTIIDWFRMLANWVERQLYAVDEWFRFRGGDSKTSLVLKAILGLVWFPIAYVFRFAFYLLVEPQVNPIKHFPVVTVSHKMLLPLVVSKDPQAEPSIFGELLVNQFSMGVAEANFWAFWIIAGIPGIFGFMAWEFVANWKLYRANRSRRLRPVVLGSHGESMRGLLRPGFHSGTVPRLFRKLRHAKPARANRLEHELAHAGEAVERFVERELVHLLMFSPQWEGVEIRVGCVQCGCQRVAVDLLSPPLSREPFRLAFENMGGKIEAMIDQRGWTERLSESQLAVFVAALRGLLDMAATDRVYGKERSEEAAPGAGFADLVRRMTWAEWVERWGPVNRPPVG